MSKEKVSMDTINNNSSDNAINIVNADEHKTVARVISTKVNIRPFSGNVENSVSIDEFLDSIENFYLSEGITSDSLRIAEVLRFVNSKEGDAYLIISSKLFSNILTWKEYKRKLLDVFQTEENYVSLCAVNQLYDIKKVRTHFSHMLLASLIK
jgi:hypothetical protein